MNPHVILLAAGKSSRTWPIAEKTLFRFCGKTVLEHQIDTLAIAGLNRICVVGNDENIEALRSVCAGITGVQFAFAIQHDLDEGIRGGILAATEVLTGDEPILVVCSNDMVENSVYTNLLDKAQNSEVDMFLVGKIVENYFPGGYLSVSGENSRITSIVEKPGAGNEPSNLVTLLVHLFRNPQQLFAALRQVATGDEYEAVLQRLFDDGVLAEAVEYDGFWQAIKYPWHLLDLTEYFLAQITAPDIDTTAQIAESAVIRGNVVVAAGARIFDHAVINGPAYIGPNTIIANHALVREAIIEADCVVGHTTEVARSVLQPHCWLHQNFVGDSIFDNNVSLGAGARTANLRLDEQEIASVIKGEKLYSQKTKFGTVIGKNVRIGINASVMPGVKIGSESFLGAGGVYATDIPEKQFTYPEFQFTSQVNRACAPVRAETPNNTD